MGFMDKIFGKKDDFDEKFDLDSNSNNYTMGDPDPLNSSSTPDPRYSHTQADPFAERPSHEQDMPTGMNTTPVDDSSPNINFGSANKSGQPTLDSIPDEEPHQPSMGQQMAHNYMNPTKEEDKPHNPLELINLKLDTIKSSLENLDLRMRHIESKLDKNEKKSW